MSVDKNFVWRALLVVSVAFAVNVVTRTLGFYDGCGLSFSLGEVQPDACISYSQKQFGLGISFIAALAIFVTPNLAVVWWARKILSLHLAISILLAVAGIILANSFVETYPKPYSLQYLNN